MRHHMTNRTVLGNDEAPWRTRGLRGGGSDRRRSGDLSIFSRTLYQLSYRAVVVVTTED